MQCDNLVNFLHVLDQMKVLYVHEKLEDLEVVDVPLPQRKTEGIRFVFRDGAYINHRIHKV